MNVIASNTIIYCDRWQETVDFYTRGLGLTIRTDKGWFVELHLSDNARISIADQRQATIKSAGGLGITLSVHVEDASAVRNELLDRGLSPEHMRSVWGSQAFFIRDPEGTRLEFWS